jgi:hypothetical protein
MIYNKYHPQERRKNTMGGTSTKVSKEQKERANELGKEHLKNNPVVKQEKSPVIVQEEKKEEAMDPNVKKDEVKTDEIKTGEVKTKEIATSHPNMCDASTFGTYDPDSRFCRSCLKDYPDCVEACQKLTEHKKIKPAKPAKLSTGKVSKRGGAKVLLSSAESGAGKVDLLLCKPEGCTMEEMRVHRGAVESHLNSLRKAVFNIVHENGRFYYRPEVKA